MQKIVGSVSGSSDLARHRLFEPRQAQHSPSMVRARFCGRWNQIRDCAPQRNDANAPRSVLVQRQVAAKTHPYALSMSGLSFRGILRSAGSFAAARSTDVSWKEVDAFARYLSSNKAPTVRIPLDVLRIVGVLTALQGQKLPARNTRPSVAIPQPPVTLTFWKGREGLVRWRKPHVS